MPIHETRPPRALSGTHGGQTAGKNLQKERCAEFPRPQAAEQNKDPSFSKTQGEWSPRGQGRGLWGMRLEKDTQDGQGVGRGPGRAGRVWGMRANRPEMPRV